MKPPIVVEPYDLLDQRFGLRICPQHPINSMLRFRISLTRSANSFSQRRMGSVMLILKPRV